MSNGQLSTSSFDYNPGNNPGDITVVQLYYQWAIYVSLIDSNLVNLGSGNRFAGRDRSIPRRAVQMRQRAMAMNNFRMPLFFRYIRDRRGVLASNSRLWYR